VVVPGSHTRRRFRRDDMLVWRSAASRAWILEGGAMRTATTAGAIHGLQLAGVAPPTAIYCSSAGALLGAYYVAADSMTAIRIYLELLAERRVISALRPWRVIDLDYLFQALRERYPLDQDKLASADTQLIVAATNASTGLPRYFELGGHPEPMKVLKATCALPGFWPGRVEIAGDHFVDGGTAALPWDRVAKDRCDACIAFLTRPADYRRRPAPWWLRGLAPLWMRGISATCRRRFLYDRAATYNRAREVVLTEASDTPRWIPVLPPEDTELPGRLTTDRGLLTTAIIAGAVAAITAVHGDRAAWPSATRRDVDGFADRVRGVADEAAA